MLHTLGETCVQDSCLPRHRSRHHADSKSSRNMFLNAQGADVLRRYLEGKARLLYPEPEDVFPCDLIDADHCRPPTSYL